MTSVRQIKDRLAIPVIVAPMFLVSTPAMVIAACREGLMGSFPAHGTRSTEVFESWLVEIETRMRQLEDEGSQPAPFAVNLVVHETNARFKGDLDLCVKHRVPVVLSSKSAPVKSSRGSTITVAWCSTTLRASAMHTRRWKQGSTG